MQEQWLPVPGFETAYQISDQGRVKSLSRKLRSGRTTSERILKAPLNGAGRHLVVLQQDRRKRCCFVYQLVTAAFLGPIPQEHCVNHKNGNCTDDRLSNLEYTTPAGNSQHAANVLQAFPLGEKHPGSKLTTGDVHKIRTLWSTGTWKQRDLAARFGVTQRAVWQVIHRITWKHVH